MTRKSARFLFCVLLWIALFLFAACTQQPPTAVEPSPIQVSLTVDGQSHNLTTSSTNVRELLEEAGIELEDADEVTPPPFTPLEDGLAITVVRVRQETQVEQNPIPFERKIVRNESMDADDPPRIVQAGKDGLEEKTVRIIYRDGVESERWVTDVTVVEEAQDEIMMVGIGAARGNVNFTGVMGYIDGGAAVILHGTTAFPEQLNTGGRLDGRVFSLSPTGSHLLYTQSVTNTGSISNTLWVISTDRGAEPLALDAQNVLWADWNPAATAPLQIAYTTADPTDLPPGWEANNDLWVADLFRTQWQPFDSEQIIEAYPATYGWWGGNYAWSPQGDALAYSYANEVGLIDLEADEEEQRVQLQRFKEYETLRDWVWVPTLSWSPDGRFLAFTNHGGNNEEAMIFDSWVIDVASGTAGRFVEQAGIWSHLHWSSRQGSESGPGDSQIAFLRAIDPLDSLRSNYTLWLMDQDGSNTRQIYPPVGENSHFPREQFFMAWGPNGRDIAFIFNNALHILNLETEEVIQVTQDDTTISHLTWAPYGAGLNSESDETP